MTSRNRIRHAALIAIAAAGLTAATATAQTTAPARAAMPATQPADVAQQLVLQLQQMRPDHAVVSAGPLQVYVTGTSQSTAWADAKGRTERAAFLGVSATPATDATLRDQLKLPTGVGLVVDTVEAGSPAAAAGLLVHDVLTKVDDQWAINAPQLGVLIRLHKPGETVTLTVIRQGERRQLTAKLVEREVFVSDASYLALPADGGVQTTYSTDAFQTIPLRTALGALTARSVTFAPMTELATAEAAANSPDVLIKDGGRTLRLVVVNGGSHLTASVGAHTVFDGQIDTPQQQQAVSPDVRKILETYKSEIDAAKADRSTVRRRVVIIKQDDKATTKP